MSAVSTEQRSATARLPLELVVFVVGAASLGAEIAAARLLAPYFGASTSCGRTRSRRCSWPFRSVTGSGAGWPTASRTGVDLCRVVALRGGPPRCRSVRRRVRSSQLAVNALDSISAGAFLGSLLGVLVLVAVPVLLLGAVAPYAVRLQVAHGRRGGHASAGRLYAISTAGSLVGTFLAALLLIPLVGTRRTFLVFALSLALVGALGLRAAVARRAAACSPG